MNNIQKDKQNHKQQESKQKDLAKLYPVETYSRVVGYLSAVGNWNKGKVSEWEDRKEYKNPEDGDN